MSNFQKHYDGKAGYGISPQRLAAILELVGDVRGKKVLEFGCGNGFLLAKLREAGAEVCGCDISPQAVKEAEENCGKAFVFDIENDDYSKAGRDYDIIIASEVIEHLLNPEKFLAEIKKLLSADGFAIITTPNFLMWSNRIKMFLGHFEYRETGFWDRGHIHFFTYYSLKKVLGHLGFEIITEANVPYRCPAIMAKLIPGWFVFQMVFKIQLKKM